MKIAKILSAQNDCLDGHIIQVEVDISRGLHAFSIVGMADKAVAEAKDRVAAAIKHSGYKSPKSRNEKVVISLAPAQLPKEGTGFDLAIAIGYLLASRDVRPTREILNCAETMLFVGELALDGNIREVSGIIPIVQAARKSGILNIFVARKNADEACLVPDVLVYPAATLKEVIQHLEGSHPLRPAIANVAKAGVKPTNTPIELREEPVGHEYAKRALRVALAGKHSIAFIGPPGTGKTLLANSAQDIVPDLTDEESLEVLAIYSSRETLLEHRYLRPPFRAPHHSASYPSIIGGGGKQPIGEITLAHKGILFLDEFPEFDRRIIEALRQPMEEKVVRIARTNRRTELPADCIIILAMNPCPCGYRDTTQKTCRCSQPMLRKYAEKISGPIIDRIDLWIRLESNDHSLSLPRNSKKKHLLANDQLKQNTLIKKALSDVREKQRARLIEKEDRDSYQHIADNVLSLLETHAKAQGMSTRSLYRTLGVAQTVADLEGSATVEEKHILEALQYRKSPF